MTSKTCMFTILTRLSKKVTKKIRNFIYFLFSGCIFYPDSAQTTITINLFVIYH